MDYYNVNWWANGAGFYSDFKSVYSPLVAILAESVTAASCRMQDSPAGLRACDLRNGMIFFFITWVATGYLLTRILDKTPNRVLWVMVMMLSFPMMYALERGNYIVVSMFFMGLFVLANNELKKIFFIGLLICTKIYCSIFLIPVLLKEKFRYAILAVVIIIAMHVIFGIIYGDPNWSIFLKNAMGYGFKSGKGWLEQVYVSTTIGSYSIIANNISGEWSVVSLVVVVGKIFVFFRTWIWYSVHQGSRLIYDDILAIMVLFCCLLVISDVPGYYSIILLFPMVAYCLRMNLLSGWAKSIFLMLLLPYPLIVSKQVTGFGVSSFGEQRSLVFTICMTMQTFVLPLLMSLFHYEITRTLGVKTWITRSKA
jgi:hypothetical protein